MARANPDSYGPPEKVLLVEGKDDQLFFGHLLDSHKITGGVQIRQALDPKDNTKTDGGYTKIYAELKSRLESRNQTHLGIVVDADADFPKRWEALRNILMNAGYSHTPAVFPVDGLILPPQEATPFNLTVPPYNPTVGIWIMPDNQSSGALEDFVQDMIPSNDAVLQHAIDAVKSLPERRFSDASVPKVHYRTWRAWQKDYHLPYGSAITKGYLRHDTDLANKLVDWHRRLFELPG